MSKVSLLKCDEYLNTILKSTIKSGFSNINFSLDSLKGKRVALKPNLLMPIKAERAVITHPEFFRAVAEIIKEYTDNIVLIESPNPVASLEKTIKKVGYLDIINELNIEVADVNIPQEIHYRNAHYYKNIKISKAYFDVDFIFNLPKLKTHGFTHYTGAVKNLFGTIPGLNKAQMHMKAQTQNEFCGFLLDLYGGLLNGFSKPKKFLHIMDAILGMEGEGPGPSGKPRQIGAVLMSDDAIALDHTAIDLVGLDLKKVLTVTMGFKRNFGVSYPSEIEVVGDNIDKMKIKNFIPSKNRLFGGVVWPITTNTFKTLFSQKPVPKKDKCTLCYHCLKICPAKAITKTQKEKKTPVYNYKKCIRCFCCVEICPEAAIKSKNGKLQWMLKTN